MAADRAKAQLHKSIELALVHAQLGGDELAAHALLDHLILNQNAMVHENIADFMLIVERYPAPLSTLFKLATREIVSVSIKANPISLGSYSSSRLLLLGAVLEVDLKSAMYALADSVRRLQMLDACRWQFVLDRQVSTIVRRPRELIRVASHVVKQAEPYIALMKTLQNEEEFEWEQRVLGTFPSSRMLTKIRRRSRKI